MSSTTRTFIAVAVPETLVTKLRRLQQQLAGEVPEARWETTLPFHITLAFLGDVDNTDLSPLCRAVAEATSRLGRFNLKLQGLGAFPSPTKPRTVWTEADGPGLVALQAEVASAAAKLNYRTEARTFHPHVTLGRFGPKNRAERDLTPLFNHYKTWHAGPFTVSEAVVFSSVLNREGASYAALGRAPLLGRKPGTST